MAWEGGRSARVGVRELAEARDARGETGAAAARAAAPCNHRLTDQCCSCADKLRCADLEARLRDVRASVATTKAKLEAALPPTASAPPADDHVQFTGACLRRV